MGSHQHAAKMGEGSKQVRVDNWGIFFLQRLQMFFNKTDYCDLTLQFEGNVQLKVHRLVMNACTEYFQVLEQTCEVIDDVLIMPSDLQADVVLPIVNFMYTGMLEFHMSIFDKLYKTANLMNITVLTKLLDAQKTPIAPLPKPTNKRNSHIPHTWNLQGKKISAKTSDPDLPAPLPGRKLPVWKRKSAPTAVPHTIVTHYFPEQKRTVQVDPLAGFDNTPKPTRFEWPEEELSTLNLFDSSFDDISYTSKPLLTQDDEPRPSTSFDRIKETPDSARRSTSYNSAAVDMEDVKDYVKEQRIRSNMTEEDDDDGADNDYDGCDLISKSNSNQESQKRKIKFEHIPAKRVRFNISEKENQIRPTKINITPTGKTAPDVDHTKIISEVLKKYPNLVKKNKNIRLKILAKSNNTPVSVEQTKKVALKKVSSKIQYQAITPVSGGKIIKTLSSEDRNEEDGPWKCLRCSTPSEPVEFVLYYLFRKHMTDVHSEKFDSRMCKFCGHKSTKHNMLMYHQYTKHGVKPPLAYNFPKCSQCPYIALTEALLLRHKMNHTKYELQCVECKVTFMNQQALTTHMQITGHTCKSGKPNYDCQYCTKKFQSGSSLFSHIRLQHRDDARRDGIVSIDEPVDGEEEEQENAEEQQEGDEVEEEEEHVEYITPEIRSEDKKEKIKILSDVKLPSMEVQQSTADSLEQQNITLEPSSEAEALSNVASGIATSLGLVDVVVLDENQQYILHTDNQQGISSGESEFILPDLQDTQTFTTTQQVITSEQSVITQSMLHNSDIGSTDELVMVLTDHDYGDGNTEIINNENSNIVVLYSHPIEGQENQFITSQGNLMLTSQAGLIELRNSNAIVTSTGSQFITTAAERAENTHIESIEMIQREINRHPDVKNQIHLVQDIKPTLVRQVSNNSVNTKTAIEAPIHQVSILTENQETVEVMSSSLTVLQKLEEDEVVEFNSSSELVTVNNTDSNQGVLEPSEREENVSSEGTSHEINETNESMEDQPMETDNINTEENQQDAGETKDQYEADNTDDNTADANTSTEFSQDVSPNFNENVKSKDQEDLQVHTVSTETIAEPSTDHTTESLRKPEETFVVEPMDTGNDEGVQEGQIKKEQTVNELEKDKKFTEAIEQPNDDKLTEDVSQPTDGNSQMEQPGEIAIAIDQTKSVNEETKDADESTVSTERESISMTIVDSEVQDEHTSQIHKENVDENPPLKNNEAKSPNGNSEMENKNSDLQEHSSQAHEASLQLQDENMQLQDENMQLQEENPQLQEEDQPLQEENSQLQEENFQLQEDNAKLQDKNSQLQDENSQLQDENSQLQDDNSQLQDNNSQLQGDNSQLQDANCQLQDKNSQLQDENSQLQDENSQLQDENYEPQDENSQPHESSETQDETSQHSQRSPVFEDASSKKTAEYLRSNSNQSAKIILDDWDDTDSQQSDSKNGTNVHKLIDDWDDDEEENKKSSV